MKKPLFSPLRPILVSAACLLGACGGYTPGGEALLDYARAQALYAGGRFPEALRLLEGMERFAAAQTLRGKAEYFSGDLEKAEKAFRRALRLRPSAAEAALYLVRVLRERGEGEAALALAESLLGDNPQDVRVLRLAADLAREQGPSGQVQAAALLDRAVEASAETALVFTDRARSRWIEGRREEALEDLRRAAVLLPWDTPLAASIEKLESIIREASQ
jgi:tetratricopeptide (TPR) repeat protein